MYRHMDITPELLHRKRPAKPLYDQIAELIREEIIRQKMRKGDVLPSMSDIANLLKVHRHTVRQAMDVLERNGVVDTTKGRNIMVKREAGAYPTIQVKTQLATHMAFTTGAEIKLLLSEKCSDPATIPTLDVPKYESYHHLKHANSKNGQVFGFVELFIAACLFVQNPSDFEQQLALRTTIASLGKENVHSIHQTLTIVKATKEVSQYLNVSFGDPVARFIRIVLDSDGKAAYIGVIHYPGNSIEVLMEMEFE